MKYRKWKAEQRRFWLTHIYELPENASYVRVAGEILTRYPRIQFDGSGGKPEDKETAAEFVAFAARAAERNPNFLAHDGR